MVTNPFGVEIGKVYQYHRPGWVQTTLVKIEENTDDAYGMQVRDIENGWTHQMYPSKLSDYPADGIFEIVSLKYIQRV